MTKEKKVSLIIPVYNTEAYLKECLDSALAQEMDDMEIICVNDGSTDSSKSILDEYAMLDSRVVVITQENQGLSGARNTGMKHAKGKYICFLDSDDMLAYNALPQLYKMAEEKKLEILCFDAMCFYENDQLKKNEYKDEYYTRKKSYKEAKSGKELFCQMIEEDDFCDAACLLFIRREWIERENICFYPRLIHEDCLFTFQCLMKVNRIEHIKEAYLKYRVRSNSIMTSKASYASMKGRIFCYTKIMEYLLSEQLSDREKEAIVKFEKFIMYNIKWTDFKLDDIERNKAIDADCIEQLISASMDVGLERQYGISENIYLRGFNDLLTSFESVVLYGAGKIGRKIYRYMANMGIGHKITCFAVTEKNGEDKFIENIPVKLIDDIENEDGMLVLISARRDFQENMLSKAKMLGFKNIEIIDFRLEQMVDKHIQ